MSGDHADDDRISVLSLPAIAASAVVRMFGYRSSMPGVHRGLPSPALTLVFPLSGALPIDVPVGARLQSARFAIPVGGLHTTPVYLPPPGRLEPAGPSPVPQRGIQLALHPLAARALFGLAASELTGGVFELGDIVGADARSLHERLDNAADSADAAKLATGWIDRRLRAAKPAHRVPELHEA